MIRTIRLVAAAGSRTVSPACRLYPRFSRRTYASTHTFAEIGIDARLSKAANAKYGVKQPTELQAQMVKGMLSPSANLLIKDSTGTGKTFAAVLSILSQTLREHTTHSATWSTLQASSLIVVPNRELALQIKDWCDVLLEAAYADLPRAKIVQCFSTQKKIVKRHGVPAIVVGTPRRLLELLADETLKFTPPRALHKPSSETASDERAAGRMAATRLAKIRSAQDCVGLRRVFLDEVDALLKLPGKHASDRQRKLRRDKPRPAQVLVDAIADRFGIGALIAANARASAATKAAAFEAVVPRRKHAKGWGKDPNLPDMQAVRRAERTAKAAVGSEAAAADGPGRQFAIAGPKSLQIVMASATANQELREWVQRSRWVTERPTVVAGDGTGRAGAVRHYCLVIENEESIRNFRPKPAAADSHQPPKPWDQSGEAAMTPWETDVVRRSADVQRMVMEMLAEVASNVISHFSPRSGSVVIFTRSDASTVQFGRVLESYGVNVKDIMLRFDESARLAVGAEHKSGEGPQVYLATEEAARGLDMVDASLVLILDIPKSTASYVHLAGRTGRFGRAGNVVSVVPVGALGWYESKMRGIFSNLGIVPEKADFVSE